MQYQHIGVLGTGSWGTALACVAAQAGRRVTQWGRSAPHVQAMAETRQNARYLPDVPLPAALTITADMTALSACDAILLCCPAQAMASMCAQLQAVLAPSCPLVICSKGIDQNSLRLMADVVQTACPGATVAALSGPTFAKEVALHKPTACTLACGNARTGAALAEALANPTFRPYVSTDLIGVEIGGAVKNVIAIACGIVEGIGLGDNARAALVTRGMAEIIRLATAAGGQAETLMGLSGMGDLILTATSMQSRNYSLGYQLGQGKPLEQILAARHNVTEGVHTVAALVRYADHFAVDMPIANAVFQIVHQNARIQDVIQQLLARPLRHETESIPRP